MKEYIDLIVAVLSGLAICIPLVVKLVENVKEATKSKNWPDLLTMVMDFMSEAEILFENGADRKAWCLGMIEASAHTVNFTIDMNVVAQIIDDICAASKVINAPLNIEEVPAESNGAPDVGVH